jgi:hypothetical protein
MTHEGEEIAGRGVLIDVLGKHHVWFAVGIELDAVSLPPPVRLALPTNSVTGRADRSSGLSQAVEQVQRAALVVDLGGGRNSLPVSGM